MNSYASQTMISKHKQQCDQNQITSIITSSDSQLHWKEQLPMNPLYFRKIADFEDYNEIANSIECDKATNI